MFTKSHANRSFRQTVQICLRLQAQARQHHPDLASLSRLVQGDTELADTLLRQVNSTVRGLAHRIESVEHAIALIGAVGVERFAEQQIARLTRLPVVVRTDMAETISRSSRVNRSERSVAEHYAED